ncbi:MAG: UDP-N-acetylmuramoyl-tripeptide--D-alanyl-D-alanine ligase, partial [Candidatus Moranbacteria bacterium]|nr:UDP-N-acetylmuramoyl-tripeptide--D-alanyl-D-alanine ligase [Candidatus Moranbacteria bacterium]NTW75950.1 UDP-N-acetylmuramoyl-tripeptide--D-alanyl-D-alanine ligase [Candidatus Moranbacteria bacterium]
MDRNEGKSGKLLLAERMLGIMARAVLRKYRPLVVGVTGSVGKSSAKEAAALVLSETMRVRKSEENYNNEIGVPLTVLGVGTGGSAVTRMLSAMVRFPYLMVWPVSYPETLVLELGVDRLGDMTALLDIVSVQIGVVTMVGESHLEYFGSIGNIAKEKGRLISSLPANGFAILNAEDDRVLGMEKKTKAIALSYGFAPGAAVRADNVLLQEHDGGIGSSFKLNYAGKSIPVRLPGVVARHHISDALAGAAVGIATGMHLVDIAKRLEGFVPLPGRLRFLHGRNGIGLLDDTYNASPASVVAALGTLGEIPARRKVAVLGDMLELGSISEESHRKLAKSVLSAQVGLVICVGRNMSVLADELLLRGMEHGNVLCFPDPDSA